MSGTTTTPPGKSRRRDKLRKHWPFTLPTPASSSTANTAAVFNAASTHSLPVRPAPLVTSNTASTASGTVTQQPHSYDILGDAFRRLSDRHQQALEPFVFNNSSDAGKALDRSLAAASQKRRDCELKQWRWTFAGRIIVLREVAGKIVDWLDRFKAVGDVVANADPIHIGLPWAGFRFMLELAVSEVHEMAAMLMGCEVALYMINRVKAYLDFLSSLPHVLTRSNFEAALTELYSRILSFLAEAVGTCQRPTLQRMLVQVWKQSALSDFENDCITLGARVEIEASNCDRTLDGQNRNAIQESQQMLRKALAGLETMRQLQESMDRLEMKFDLGNLKIVQSASFDAHGQVHSACHPNTRVHLLQVIQDWARARDSKNIFWLQGMAGTGKSTISYTFADWLYNQHPSDMTNLGASFFFKRGEVDRGSAALLFPTIIHQLTRRLPGLGVLVAEVVGLNPDICSKSLAIQFQTLVVQPLQQLSQASVDTRYIIVVDALDECEKDDIDIVLRLWSTLPATVNDKLRLFITSRPELPIQLGFKKISVDRHHDVVLHDIPESVVRNDLLIFLADAFLRLRDEYNLSFPEAELLSNDWPGDQILQQLADMASPLFIVAATICLFVGDHAWDPRERLETILSSRKLGQTSNMAQIYLPVLQQLSVVSRDRTDEERLYDEYRVIVGSIVSLAEPLSRRALATLLETTPQSIGTRLRPFASVLLIPKDVDAPIRPLHLSFGEYVTSSEIADQPFSVQSEVTHGMLLTKSIRLLSRPSPQGLCENMCGFRYPGQYREDLASTAIQSRLSMPVQYACRYWTYHAQRSKVRICDNDEIHQFLQLHFLHWLEALVLLGCLNSGIDGVENLLSLVSDIISTSVTKFLRDARRFLSANRHLISLAPLQLYSSATLFAPQNSVIKNVCGRLPDWVEQSPIVQKTWSSELHRWEGHLPYLSAGLSFSPDGLLLVTTTMDDVMRVWNVRTGNEVLHLEGHDGIVQTVSFSTNGSRITSVSNDGTIRLWDAKTGREILQMLQEELKNIEQPRQVTFSPNDDPILASISECSDDGEGAVRSVLLWNARTRNVNPTLCRVTSPIRSMTFSPSGLSLAIAAKNKGLEIWHVETRQKLCDVEGHTEIDITPAFSYDDSLFAAASSGCNVRVWDVQTGRTTQELAGHTAKVKLVVFSPGGPVLASASEDKTIRLWNTDTWQTLYTLHDNPDVEQMVFSHDGLLLAALCEYMTIRLYNVANGQVKQSLCGHTGLIGGLFFSPDSSLIASACWDGTVRLWNTAVQSVLPDSLDMEGHLGDVQRVLFSPDGSKLASTAYSDTKILIWDTESGFVSHRLENDSHQCEGMVFSTDGSLLVSSYIDGTIRVWDLLTGKETLGREGLAMPCEFQDETSRIVISPCSSLMASTSRDGTIIIEELQTGRELSRLYPGVVGAIKFSPDSSVLVSTSSDGTLRLWKVDTGALLLDASFEDRDCGNVLLSEDGLLFALGPTPTVDQIGSSTTHTILIGNVRNGTILVSLSVASWEASTMAFSLDASLLAAVSYSGRTVKLWNTNTGEQTQAFEDYEYIRDIKFAQDGKSLLTNRGSIFIGAPEPEPETSRSYPGFILKDEWIVSRNKRILRLPHEYRSDVTAVHGNLLAIGQRSGTVSFLRLRQPEGLETIAV